MVGWAVVGVGDITSKRVLPAIADEPRSRLRAVVTRNPERTRAVCEQFRAERVCTTLEEALADPQVTAVYVATPVALHYPQTMAALAAGKHVLCEKPTALKLEHVENMIATAKAAERHFGVSFYRRLYPALGRARELMRDGVIGQPTLVWVTCHGWMNDLATSHRAWLFDPAQSGGGPLMDVGSHRIDLLNYLFGEPTLAGAAISRQTQNTPGFQVEDNATLTIDYRGEFGPVRAVVDVRWNSHIARDDFRIFGTDGDIDITPLNDGCIRCAGKQESLPNDSNFHRPLLRHFADVLEDGAALICSGEEAILTDRIIAEAYAKAAR
jgi:1,5-anhydro-D-fructose reductase (1,5-anhydro-D-mannitol-forming)